MNTPKMNYAAVGAFVIAMLVGVVFAVAMLTGRTGATDSYHAIYRNVTGVKFGTQVIYEGYPIGQVETVTPKAKDGAMRFRVDFEVNEGWQIPEDSIARIGANGLLSAITINISAGTSPITLKPGTAVIAGESQDLFKVMSNVADEITTIAQEDVRPLLAAIRSTVDTFSGTVETVDVLLDEDGERMIRQFADMAEDLAVRVPRITKNLDQGTADFAVLAGELNDTRSKLDTLLVETEGLVGENRGALRKSIVDLRHVTDSLARHIEAVNQNVEGTARNMFEFSREIRKNPGLLLSGSAPAEQGAK